MTNKRWISSIACLSTLGALSFGLTPTAMAATTRVVTVEHNAYLIAAPHLHAHRLALETAGTKLTIESGGNRYWWHVKDADGRDGYITTNHRWTSAPTRIEADPTTTTSTATNTAPTTTTPTTTATSGDTNSGATTPSAPFQLPPGVTLDASITPLASTSDTPQQKFDAILQIAQSKLGTPYIWGHNEDRGQYGFDCSNFVEYVYHHALGYHFTTASREQYTSVGTPVPISDMQPGDLLCFNDGGHSGIYIGNGEMIQEGGGLGKVGYLKVSPGSYWYNHLSAVKRMY